MSYIKNVYGEFKLAENKVIEFPMLKNHILRTALEESEANKSYLADISYIDAFAVSLKIIKLLLYQKIVS